MREGLLIQPEQATQGQRVGGLCLHCDLSVAQDEQPDIGSDGQLNPAGRQQAERLLGPHAGGVSGPAIARLDRPLILNAGVTELQR